MVTKVSKNITGVIANISFGYVASGDNMGNEYANVDIQEPGQRYATKCKAWDADLVERFKKPEAKGSTIGLAIEESEGAINPHTQKPYINRNIVAIVPADAAQPAAAPVENTPHPHVTDDQAERRRIALDPRGDSIERQTASIQASQLVAAGIVPHTPNAEPVGGGQAVEVEHSGFSAWNAWFDHIIAKIQGTEQFNPDTE